MTEFIQGVPVPVIKNIHQRVYKAASQPGALNMNSWHTCVKTHCRGGWVVMLAGQPGLQLAARISTGYAAAKIYAASGYRISQDRFTDSNDVALADMRRLALKEKRAAKVKKPTTRKGKR